MASGVPTASISSANLRISSSKIKLIRWPRSALVRAAMSRNGPAPNSEVSSRPGTAAVLVSSSPEPSRPIISTVASESSSRDTALEMDRLVTFSACTRCVTWSCHPLTARAAVLVVQRPLDRARAAQVPAKDQVRFRGELGPGPGCRVARSGQPLEQRGTGRVFPPAGQAVLRGPVRDRGDDGLDRRARRRLQRLSPGRAAVPPLLASPPRLQRAEQVTGAGEVLPPGEHLAAHQGAVLQRLVDLGQGRL